MKKSMMIILILTLFSVLVISITINIFKDSSDQIINNLTSYPEGYIMSSSSSVKGDFRKNVKVALLDSGVNEKLLKIEENSISYISFLKQPTNRDTFGHGTAIAGIWYGNEEIEGIVPYIELIDIQVIDEYGTAEIDNVIQGINYAIEQGADIINISFGFDQNDYKLEKAVKKAVENGILIVAATGNNILKESQYPAKYNNVLSISAIDEDLNIYEYASTTKVDYVAPGVQIPIVNEINNQNIVDGTSFATAYVTGAVAHLVSLGLSYNDVQDKLKKFSYEIRNSGYRLVKLEEENY